MASSVRLSDAPPEPDHGDQLKNAHLILVHAHDAAKALLAAFDDSRGKRRKTGGTTTDEEQDLLRAMLVFAGAGLDASVKRVIQDALPLLAKKNPAARESLQMFTGRRLRDEARAAADSAKGYDLMARALASESPQSAVVAAYVDDLIGSSLQSPERVFSG